MTNRMILSKSCLQRYDNQLKSAGLVIRISVDLSKENITLVDFGTLFLSSNTFQYFFKKEINEKW